MCACTYLYLNYNGFILAVFVSGAVAIWMVLKDHKRSEENMLENKQLVDAMKQAMEKVVQEHNAAVIEASKRQRLFIDKASDNLLLSAQLQNINPTESKRHAELAETYKYMAEHEKTFLEMDAKERQRKLDEIKDAFSKQLKAT